MLVKGARGPVYIQSVWTPDGLSTEPDIRFGGGLLPHGLTSSLCESLGCPTPQPHSSRVSVRMRDLHGRSRYRSAFQNGEQGLAARETSTSRCQRTVVGAEHAARRHAANARPI